MKTENIKSFGECKRKSWHGGTLSDTNDFIMDAHEYLCNLQNGNLFSKWLPPKISKWDYLGRFSPDPIILCYNTFLGFLIYRKSNLTFSN